MISIILLSSANRAFIINYSYFYNYKITESNLRWARKM